MSVNIFPNIAPSSLEIGTYQPSRQVIAHSGKRFSQTSNIQRWTLKASYSLLSRADASALFAMLVSAKGKHEVFNFVPAVYANTAGAITGTATTAAAAVGATKINFTGTSGTLMIGDYIKFSNHDKVYIVLGASTGTATLEPPLYTQITAMTRLIYNAVAFKVSLESDKSAISIKPPALGNANISLIEVVT